MMGDWIDHLIVLPVLLPLLAAALILLLDEQRLRMKRAISIAVSLSLIVLCGMMLQNITLAGFAGEPATRVYQIGNWPAPFGIVLVADWLSAIMLAMTNLLGLAALIYATARWDSAGPRFHALFLLQLMGLNGAFLTGDIFNLFVFFEVLLAASYGLMLHGSGKARVAAGLHYVTINVAASLLFLIGAALIYGVAGTLNMADLALRIPTIAGEDLALFQAGMGVLGIAFLVKAGMWPLGFWLPATYAAAAPPVGGLFAILSKVGVYALLRVYLCCSGPRKARSRISGASGCSMAGSRRSCSGRSACSPPVPCRGSRAIVCSSPPVPCSRCSAPGKARCWVRSCSTSSAPRSPSARSSC